MADSARIEELRRRVQKDPASIAFAQLAEEYRRAGRLEEAVDTCAAGLGRHPGYLSARVTLGRALIELGQLDAAQEELKHVLGSAPENLAALRGLADIHHRRGELREALAHYRTALEFAPHDPELERLVEEIREQLEPSGSPVVVDGLSFEEVQREILAFSGPDEPRLDAAFDTQEADAILDVPTPDVPTPELPATPIEAGDPAPAEHATSAPAAASEAVEALEHWLEAIVADRERRAAAAPGEGE